MAGAERWATTAERFAGGVTPEGLGEDSFTLPEGDEAAEAVVLAALVSGALGAGTAGAGPTLGGLGVGVVGAGGAWLGTVTATGGAGAGDELETSTAGVEMLIAGKDTVVDGSVTSSGFGPSAPVPSRGSLIASAEAPEAPEAKSNADPSTASDNRHPRAADLSTHLPSGDTQVLIGDPWTGAPSYRADRPADRDGR